MKNYLTFFLIAVMSLGLVFLLLTRPRDKHDAPAEVIEVKAEPVDAGVDAAAIADAAPEAAPVAVVDAAPIDAGPTKRPLRVTTLGWELAVPGAEVKLSELAPEYNVSDVAARLAKGGDDPAGADIAIMPLPSFIATYEKIRALDPQIFLVTAFSRGREEVRANPGALVNAPAGNDEVKVVSGATDSATTAVLWALDVLGVAPARIRLVAADTPEGKAAAYAGVVKGTADPRKLAFSTADASRLIPIVAIAPRAYIDNHLKEVEDWSAAWIDNCKTGPTATANARKLAAKTGVPFAANVGGAPDAVALVEQVGLLECTTVLPGKPAKLDEPADVGALLTGYQRPFPSITQSLTRLWSIERAGGLVSIELPTPSPVDERVAMELIRVHPLDYDMIADDGGLPPIPPFPATGLTLLTFRGADVDTASADFMKFGPMFPRAVFRVSAKGGKKAADPIVKDITSSGIYRPERFSASATEPKGAPVTFEVIAR